MSHHSVIEYTARCSERYLSVKKPATKRKILDEFVQTTGFERKYAIKLLRGKRGDRERKVRGKIYPESARRLLVDLWKATGCLCSKYLKANL